MLPTFRIGNDTSCRLCDCTCAVAMCEIFIASLWADVAIPCCSPLSLLPASADRSLPFLF